MADIGKLGRALTLAGALAASPAVAENQPNQNLILAAQTTSGQITDCIGFVREQRDLARESNIVMSRGDQTALLDECESGQLQVRIEEQQVILAALSTELEQFQMSIDANNRILDENDQVIAFIVSINGQWVIQQQLEADIERSEAEIAASRARQQELLREADLILQRLLTS